MPDTKSFDEIVAAATAEKERWQTRERAINTEINRIKAADPILSTVDKKQIADLREEKKILLKAIGILGIETAEAIDSTDRVDNLLTGIRGVRQELEGRRQKLLRVAEAAQKFGNTLKAISQIAETVSSIEERLDKLTQEPGGNA